MLAFVQDSCILRGVRGHTVLLQWQTPKLETVEGEFMLIALRQSWTPENPLGNAGKAPAVTITAGRMGSMHTTATAS